MYYEIDTYLETRSDAELNDFKAVSIVYMFCKNYNLPFPKEAFERKKIIVLRKT